MERLTFDGNFCDIVKCDSTPGGTFCESGTCTMRKVWERLKEYEDAEQDGRLVVLPCGTNVELESDGYTFKADHWSHIYPPQKERNDPLTLDNLRGNCRGCVNEAHKEMCIGCIRHSLKFNGDLYRQKPEEEEHDR